MKRIIDGKTYNTDTATLIGQSDGSPPAPKEDKIFEHLYQTRYGAYFLYVLPQYWYEEIEDHYGDDSIRPLTPSEAQSWMENNCDYRPELIEEHFGEMPEAGAGEVKFTLRMPESLKRRIEGLAAQRKQSLNAWIVRCVENCASIQEAGPTDGGD